MSNYTVLVWAVVDLLCLLVSRNVYGLIAAFNSKCEAFGASKGEGATLKWAREELWLLCDLVDKLGSSGLNEILLATVVGSTYFLWSES